MEKEESWDWNDGFMIIRRSYILLSNREKLSYNFDHKYKNG